MQAVPRLQHNDINIQACLLWRGAARATCAPFAGTASRHRYNCKPVVGLQQLKVFHSETRWWHVNAQHLTAAHTHASIHCCSTRHMLQLLVLKDSHRGASQASQACLQCQGALLLQGLLPQLLILTSQGCHLLLLLCGHAASECMIRCHLTEERRFPPFQSVQACCWCSAS